MRWIFFIIIGLNVFPSIFAPKAEKLQIATVSKTMNTRAGNVILLSEIDANERQPLQLLPETSVLPARREPACFVVGPLATKKLAKKIVTTLAEKQYKSQYKWREIDAGTDYWLYLDAQPSSRATARLIEELSASDIDAFAISEGEMKGVIALNVYNDKSLVDKEQADLVARGYEAKIHTIQRRIREYWLLADKIPRSEDWRFVAETFKDEALPQKMSRRSCKTVASAMRFQ